MKEQITKIKETLLYVLAFIIPCCIYAAPPVIIAYSVFWIAEGNLKNKFSAFIRNKYALLFGAFYIMHLIGMLYTPYAHAGWFDVQVKLSLILFPILMVSEGKMEFKRQRIFIWAFIIGLIVNGLICIAKALWLLLAKNDLEFQYSQFSLFLHPSYYSMYIDVAVVLIFYLLTENRKTGNKKDNIFLFLAFFFLEFIIVLLQSKMGLIVSATVIVIVLVRYLSRENPWPTAIVLIAGVCGMYFVSYHYIITAGRSRMLYAEDILRGQHLSDTSSESTQARLYVWRAALRVVKTVPVLGAGTGAVHQVLEQEYQKEGMLGAMKKKLNSHNQYLEILLELGPLGLILLLACLFVPLYIAIKQKRFVYIMFLYIFMMNITVECILQVQSGTIFYGFFNSLLMFNFLI